MQVGPFTLLCFQPFVKQCRFSVKKTVGITVGLCLWLAAVFALAGCTLHGKLPANMQLFIKVNVVFLITLVPCFFWYLYAIKVPWPKKLFVFSYAFMGAFLINSVNNGIITKLYLGRSDGLPYQGYTLLVLSLLTAVFLPILSMLLKKHYNIMWDSFTDKESIYLSILIFGLFTLLFLGMVLYGYSSLYHPVTLFLYSVLILSVFVIIGTFFRVLNMAHEKLEAQQKYDEVRHQFLIQEEQYRRISESVEMTRRMRHDFRHHMVTLHGFLENGKIQHAKDYLNHFLLIEKSFSVPNLCDNDVVNTVVGHYQSLAEEQEIRFSVRISVPKELEIPNVELSVLLGNLLENAIDAVLSVDKDDRYICFNMIRSGKMLAITVDNSFNGTVKLDGAHYLSTKKQHSGFGLKSIEMIAEKYSGGVEFTHEGNVFHSSVMLNESALQKIS